MGNCLPGGARGLAQGFVEDRLSETIDDTTENIGSKAVNHQSTFDYPRVTRPNGLFLNPRYLDANPCRKPCIYVFSTCSKLLAAGEFSGGPYQTAGRGAGFSRFLLLVAGEGESRPAGEPCSSAFNQLHRTHEVVMATDSGKQ